MSQQIETRFRPCLIISVGKVGTLIREYLSPYYGEVERHLTEPLSAYHLLSNLDRPLRNSVALLHVETEGLNADADSGIPFAVAEVFPRDPDIPIQRGPLTDLIDNSLVSVQLDRRILDIRSSGYAVPNTRTQIFIVGEPNDENKRWFSKILKMVRKCVRGYHFETQVCYVLNSYKDPADYSPGLKKSLGDPKDNWQMYEVANFSYVFEQVIPFPAPVFVNKDEARYATAESIFALAATGIASLPIFEDEMRISPTMEDYAHHIGNLSTSMILFPRAMTRRYCGAMLSSVLMQKWQDDLSKTSIPGNRRIREREEAQRLTGGIESWIIDSRPRPMAEESQWPNFGILFRKDHPESEQVRYRQVEAFRQLESQTEKLFGVFSPEEITEIYRNRKDKAETWASIAYNQCAQAVNLSQRWEQCAKSAWEMLGDRINAEIRQQIDTRWSENKDGFEVARIYVDELDDRLTELLGHVSRWRYDHDGDYKAKRTHFLELSDGTWAVDENEPNIGGAGLAATGQARPTMGLVDSRVGAGSVSLPRTGGASGAGGGGLTSGSGGSGGSPPASGGPQYLPPMESEIARNLRLKASWKQNHIPPVATLCTSGFLGWLTLALTTSSIPSLSPIVALIVKAILVGVFAAGGVALFIRRWRESNAAQHDALDFYRLYYIHNCENREDLERVNLMKTLRSRVFRIRRRLDDMGTFLKNVRSEAEKEAETVRDQLFNGPAGARDIFIANGERLQEHGNHTLDSVANKVEQTRQNHPLQDWHRNLDKMRDELIQTLKQRNETLLEMTEERVLQFFYSFTSDIIDGYLTGSLVDLGTALDKPEIWREILERVRRPLYHAEVGQRDPQFMFVCGSAHDLTRSARYIPDEAIQVRTKSTEWLIIAAFFRGGSPKMVDAKLLFPVRDALTLSH